MESDYRRLVRLLKDMGYEYRKSCPSDQMVLATKQYAIKQVEYRHITRGGDLVDEDYTSELIVRVQHDAGPDSVWVFDSLTGGARGVHNRES